jgi:multiple sugar transport system permease protein
MTSRSIPTQLAGVGAWLGGLPDYYVKWLLVGPSVLLLLFLTVYPTLSALYMSFHQWETTMIDRPFVGLDNYQNLLTDDDRFSNAMLQTAIIGGVSLSLQMAAGLLLALLFSGDFQGKKVLTTIYLIPMMISPVVVGFTARMAFTNQYGFIPQILDWIWQQPLDILWLSNAFWAKVVIILADSWQWTPFVFMSSRRR